MRGADETSGPLFSYVDSEARVSERHPLSRHLQCRAALAGWIRRAAAFRDSLACLETL